MADYVTILGSMFLLAFAVCSIMAGIFAAYFGSGKSRGIGGGLIIVGIIFLWLLHYLMFTYSATKGVWTLQILYDGIAAIIGGIIGALVALGIFLVAIMGTPSGQKPSEPPNHLGEIEGYLKLPSKFLGKLIK